MKNFVRTFVNAVVFGWALASAGAAGAAECPGGKGIYRGVDSGTHELVFTNWNSGYLKLKAGKITRKYPFISWYSNGYGHFHLQVNSSNTENPNDDDPSTVVIAFEKNFKKSKRFSSDPVLVTPGLPGSFYYWDPFRNLPDHDLNLLPDYAWKLVGCNRN